MTGFKNFLLRGNLVEIAVGLIMALAFATVVSTFTAWLMSLIPGLDDAFDASPALVDNEIFDRPSLNGS